MKKTAITVVFLNILLLVSLVSLTVHHYITTTASSNSTYTQHSVNTSVVMAQISRLRAAEPSDAYRRDLTSIYQREGNIKKPAAHCLLSPGFSTTDDLSVLHWICQDNITTFSGKGVTYVNGSLVVAAGGYYFAYSQIIYRGEGTAELDYGRIIHKVLKQKASELHESPTTLMQNLQSTPTIRRGRLAYTTSSLGATFYLHPGSRVSVESSIPRNIDTVESPYSTTFGLFLV